MKRYFCRLLIIPALSLLVAACSLSADDGQDDWSGSWIYESNTARLNAVLDLHGTTLTGTVTRVLAQDQTSPVESSFTIEATVHDGTATGTLTSGSERYPMTITRQGDEIRFEVVVWSWRPVLTRQEN